MNTPNLTPDQIRQLEYIIGTSPLPIQRRARLLLLYEAGLATREVADQVALSRSQTRYWRQQFQLRGMEIFPAEIWHAVEPEAPPIQVTEDNQSSPQPEELPYPLPTETVGILTDDPMAEAGRKTLKFHFAQMLVHEPGTRQGIDPEELHDMRVATRRMRAAFAVFEGAFTNKTKKKHLKGLRAIGKALGRARDMDVILGKINTYLKNLTEEDQAGMQPLVQAWENEHKQAHLEMLSYLDTPEYSSFMLKFNLFVNTPGMGALPIRESPPMPFRVREVAPALIYARLEAVRAYDPVLANATLTQLHALRIECKRFRYTVEFFREVLGEQAKTIIDELKGMQDHLGDLHDADVTCQILRQFLTEWDSGQAAKPLAKRQNPQPIVTYLALQSAELHRLLVTFPETWAHFNQPEFRMNLALAVATL